MNTRKPIIRTLSAVIVITALAFGGLTSSAQAQGGPPALFGDAADVALSAQATSGPQVMRERFVTVNTAMLFDATGKQAGKYQLPEVTLNLFPDAIYTGVVTRAFSDNWGYYWNGTLKEVKGGYFYLTVVENVLMAHVASPHGVYEVSLAGGDFYKATQVDQSKFIDHDEAWTYQPSGDVIQSGSLGAAADSAARIDIMVAYTDDARAAAGGMSAIKATILTALNETNTSYANAGISTRLRLVHVQEYSYVETGNMSTDLTRFRNSGDGYFDSIHSLRNSYGADMVGLIVENGGSYCGLASTIMATAATAFQVTDRSCATGYYSFGHEFGHLQGAGHDVDAHAPPTNPVFSYGHGYVYVPDLWRTIMAYDTKCQNLGTSCLRLQWWSNPNKTYGGAAMGVTGETENYRVLNETAYTVANFRTKVIANNFNSGFNGSAAGWSAAKGVWTVGPAYYQSTGLSGKVASAKRTGKYGDVTYEVRMKRTGLCTGCANMLFIRGNPLAFDTVYSWKPGYAFMYSNTGSFQVLETTSTGTTVAKKSWTASSAIVKSGWNTLKVKAVGGSLKFFINNVLVWSGSDSSLLVGQLGVGFYRDANAGTLQVDWAKASTTATADLNPYGDVAPGVELEGGTFYKSP
jgi:hypothetical protein